MLRGASSGSLENRLQFPYYLYLDFIDPIAYDMTAISEPINIS
jgi:hypothetical protein